MNYSMLKLRMYSTCRVHVSRLLVILELYVLNEDRSNSSGGGYICVCVAATYVQGECCVFTSHTAHFVPF